MIGKSIKRAVIIVVYCESIKDFSKKLTESGALLGVDYGSKKIGISISDKNRIFSVPYVIIKEKNFSEACKKIHQIINQKKVSGVVIGYPLETNGDAGKSCDNVKNFVEKL
ncbi:MAG: Holliday junction resolvase RuvX, partial [Alphaproteobacteria bacterium]|nr:Holliday junction resolvase RuvX [Alphaproteobacteria bacterium]